MNSDKTESANTLRTAICCAKIGSGHGLAPLVAKVATGLAAAGIDATVQKFEACLESAEGLATLVLPIANHAGESAVDWLGTVS